MESNIKVHVNMADIVAAGEHLHMFNQNARHKYHSLTDWYTFIMATIKRGVERGDEMCSGAGVTVTFEYSDEAHCHVDISVSPQFGHDNYVTFDVE